jgi:hypothetical protein
VSVNHTSKRASPPLEVDLPGQFLLGRSESLAPGGWAVRRSAGWCLATHPTLPVLEIRAREGALLGWLLGYPIGPDGTLLSADSLLPFALSVRDGASQFERALYALGGRFAAVFGLPWTPRVYLDPCGSLAVVFCPEEGIVTSNPMLIPYSEKTRANAGLIEVIGRADLGYYPYGLTPRCGIERLLPNHVLDLSTWEASRHWPSSEDLATMKDTAVAVSEIASILERQITAVVRGRPTYIALTGGRHTRMMLACAQRHLDSVTFFTMQVPGAEARLDVDIAKQMAKRFGLAHETLPWDEPTRSDLDEWLYRTGGCVVGDPAQAVRILRQLDPGRGVLSGIAGSVADADWWTKRQLRARTVSVDDLLNAYRLPPMSNISERVGRWLSGLPTRNTLDVLGLRSLEQRLAGWGGPQEYGYAGDAFVLSPYCHRRIVQLKLTLPEDYRWRDQLHVDLLNLRWPQLLMVPFDKSYGFRDAPLSTRVMRRVRRHVTLPRKDH